MGYNLPAQLSPSTTTPAEQVKRGSQPKARRGQQRASDVGALDQNGWQGGQYQGPATVIQKPLQQG